ncbi:MAG: DNA alkylation repair protein [Endomicrobiales bacterium]|nr:DNA alkylation repair protein [Endomicrobiales bacterium]
MHNANFAVRALKSRAKPENLAGLARYGINTRKALGVNIPSIRDLAKEIGKDQDLSLKLWRTGIHEARLLAGFIGPPQKVTEKQMEKWASDFDSWDVCDQVVSNLFDRTPFAYKKAAEWSKRNEEFVKRAGFVLMAALSVHDKESGNAPFVKFLSIIARESRDSRNFVKKAVNWALRQIGKRNLALRGLAVKTAKKILTSDDPAARWIASDALRELTNLKGGVMKRLQKTSRE